jgi:hypothetical protein
VVVTEAQVQRQIIDGLEAYGAEVLLTHGPRNKPVVRGIADLIAVLPGRVLFVECKGEGGKASEDQLAFLARMREKGHVAIVAHGWEDVAMVLTNGGGT